MRRITWVMAIVVCVVVLLVGCGKKDAGEVVKDLDGAMNHLESYEGAGTMILHTGVKPQEYSVEVWYKDPHFYRIALTNGNKDVTQIVLKNDDGVFVLTPELNKSFRFQSDWPEKHGQAYLYHTLVQGILQDENRQFTMDGDAYVFDVASNLQNHSLVRQRIWLNKKDYAPLRMEASDIESNVLLEVKFSSFTMNKKFDDDSFEMERNMVGYEIQSLPTLALEEGDQDAAEDMVAADKDPHSFGILMPAYVPEGVADPEVSEIKLGDEAAIMLRYTGDYYFTLVESRPADRAASTMPGTVVNLNYTMGIMLGDERKTLIWTNDGVEFRLSSGELPEEEMIKIAQSMEEQIGK